MTIAVRGVNFINKGAELMLHAVRAQVRQWSSASSGRTALSVRTGTAGQRRAAGAHHFTQFDSLKYPLASDALDAAASLLPEALRRRAGLVVGSEVEAVFDASGFAYTDQWGAEKAVRKAKLTAVSFQKARARGQKTILLPQALGPFEHPAVRAATARMMAQADLVFARDDTSYQHVMNLDGPLPPVEIAPDFTNLLSGAHVSAVHPLGPFVCIVPSYRMVDRTRGEVAERYLPFLVTCTRHFRQRGLPVKFLIHDTAQDQKLAHEVGRTLGRPVEIIEEGDPLAVKGIIGQSFLTVSSRFHGLVNALSQGIPAIATSWSHKYRHLMDDYGLRRFLLSPSQEVADWKQRLSELTEHRDDIAKHVAEAGAAQRRKTEAMWARVWAALGR